MKDWFVPVLRHLVSAIVAAFAAWLLQEAGVEITAEQQEFLTGTITTAGAVVIAALWVVVSKWLKPRFLRGWHPGTGFSEKQDGTP